MQIDILKPFFKSIEHYNYDASTQSDLVFICHSVNAFHIWIFFFASVRSLRDFILKTKHSQYLYMGQ